MFSNECKDMTTKASAMLFFGGICAAMAAFLASAVEQSDGEAPGTYSIPFSIAAFSIACISINIIIAWEEGYSDYEEIRQSRIMSV